MSERLEYATGRPVPRGAASIVGAGMAGLGEAPGFTEMELLVRASQSALSQAGLSVRDVDGLFATTAVHAMPSLSVAEYMGIRPVVSEATPMGGASFVHYVAEAARALAEGRCRVALIAYGSNQRTASGKLVSPSASHRREAPYKPRYPITAYALAANRHMAEFGTTREQLAEVAVAARGWAGLNPEAFMRTPLTLDAVIGARMVADPLTVLDCCLVTDGAAAIVMTRTDEARDLTARPVPVLGGGTASRHRNISAMPDLTETAARDSGALAYESAGLKPGEIGLAMLYDAFTINTILFLEDLGFCAKGEGGSFVAGGAIGPGGRLPVNTNGGGLSFCHPGMYGLFLVVEAVRQLRGEAGERQVDDLHTALCHGNGGVLSAQSTIILGDADAV
ncbi:acetyl-CoA acetyltransferase [Fodinicurvata sp. EGI_FJ10296]|uniref:acetyl-CoA acetyltransferase n=1 Tax=Fodinicurvata sp. EGI_FJ10296 TaxID=3231908 RepID=UPI0034516C45